MRVTHFTFPDCEVRFVPERLEIIPPARELFAVVEPAALSYILGQFNLQIYILFFTLILSSK